LINQSPMQHSYYVLKIRMWRDQPKVFYSDFFVHMLLYFFMIILLRVMYFIFFIHRIRRVGFGWSKMVRFTLGWRSGYERM
jgi:hypothetical protein